MVSDEHKKKIAIKNKSSANLYLFKFLEIKKSFKIIFKYLINTLPAGFEPAAHCLEGSCSIQLS